MTIFDVSYAYLAIPVCGMLVFGTTLLITGIKHWPLLVMCAGCIIAFLLSKAVWNLVRGSSWRKTRETSRNQASANNYEPGIPVDDVHLPQGKTNLKQEDPTSHTGNEGTQNCPSVFHTGNDVAPTKQEATNSTNNGVEPPPSYGELRMAPPKYEAIVSVYI